MVGAGVPLRTLVNTAGEVVRWCRFSGQDAKLIASWNRQAIDGMASTFSGAGDAAKAVSESEVEKLHAKIGQLVVERDFLAKAFGR